VSCPSGLSVPLWPDRLDKTRTFVRLVRHIPRVKRYARIGSDAVACSGAPFRVRVSPPYPLRATHAQGLIPCVQALLWVARDARQQPVDSPKALRVGVSSRGA
jgi:hypothetical protein